MKKFAVLFVLGFSLALSLVAQRNTFYYGDKNAAEIDNSIELFNELIDDYERSISSLQKENEKMVSDFQKPGGEQFAKNYAKKTTVNDSLIGLYRSKVLDLKETKYAFLEKTAGSGKKMVVSSKGNNPEKLRAASDAYATMRYVDSYTSGNGKSGATNETPARILKGLIVNEWHENVTFYVYGPGIWEREFRVPGDGRVEFDIPSPGEYRFVSVRGREINTITKTCRPGVSGFQDSEGNKYDIMTTLQRRGR